MIPKPSPVAPVFEPLKAPLDHITELLNKGLIADSPDIRAEKQPDGRIKLKRVKPAAAPAAHTCPNVANITVEFSGILLDCGCVDASAIGEGSLIATDVDVNGAFVCSQSGAGRWDATTSRTYRRSACDGTGGLDVPISCAALCDATGWQIYYNAGQLTVFFAIGILGSPVSVANQANCAGVFFGSLIGIGHGGTATISF